MELQDLKEAILSAKSISIITHKNPDGDAIGSSYGLANVLNAINPCATVIVPNEFPKFLNWIENVEQTVVWENEGELVENKILSSDIVFCLDFNALHRIDQVGEIVGRHQGIKVMIDHHLSPEDFADYCLSETTASSTAELVFEFLSELQFTEKLTPGAAEALYCGIMTDTGSFKFPSTSKRTHEIVAELIKFGANNGKVHSLVYDSNSINRLKILGHCLDKMEVVQGKVSLFTLPKAIQEEFSLIKGDTEGIVNYGLSVKEIQASAFMREDDGIIKISFRSKGELDMNLFARKYFNGGGHRNAAGGMSTLTLDEAKAYFIESISTYLMNSVTTE